MKTKLKRTEREIYGNSFLGVTIKTTACDLIEVLGEPNYLDDDLTNFEWRCLFSNKYFEDEPIVIYDWNEGRKIDKFEEIEFHIAGKNKFAEELAKEELERMIKSVKFEKK